MKKRDIINNINPLILKGIAHRGLHNDKYTENSMYAFKNAIENNLAFELDVHLSKDGHLIVNHDDSLKRTTLKEGIIEELTLKEIKENYTLLDGSKVPTLKEVLSLNNESVPIIIELKVRNRNYKPLAKKLIEELKDIKDHRNYMIISFDPRALIYIKKLKIVNSLLVTTSHAWIFSLRFLFDSIDIDKNMINLKKVRRYQKKHFLNVWTIENEEDLNNVYPYVDTMTFQYIEKEKIENSLTKKNF